MATLPDTYHLLRRNGVWYYRRRVPDEHVALFGAKFVQRSLGTKDKAVAKRKRTICDLEFDARVTLGRSPSVAGSSAPQPDPGISKALLFEYVRRFVADRDRKSLIESAEAEPTPQQMEEWRQTADEDLSILSNLENPNALTTVQTNARAIAKKSGIDTAAASFPGAEFESMVRKALVELAGRRLARLSGDTGRVFIDALFDPDRPAEVPVSVLAEQYMAQADEEGEARGYAQQGRDKVRANVALVVELIGPTKLVREMNYDECMRVRSLLARLPSNRTKFYPTLSVADAIKRGAAEGRPTLSVTTQGQYLATLRGLLQLAVLKGLLRNNPAEGLQPLARDELSDAEKRDPFSDEQIVRFFTSSFYRSCAPGSAAQYDKPDREWRFWLPLVCLFMGMRPREVCQSTLGCVKRTEAGVWYFDIAASADDDGAVKKTLKTVTSRRRVPIHPELQAIGLVEMVRRRLKKEGCDAPLLLGLKTDRRGNPANYALKRFRETFLPEAITVGARQTFYSFRHSFRDALRRCEAPPEALQALGGWSQGKLTSSNYGNAGNPDLQRKWIEKVAFPGLDLAFLHVPQANLTEMTTEP